MKADTLTIADLQAQLQELVEVDDVILIYLIISDMRKKLDALQNNLKELVTAYLASIRDDKFHGQAGQVYTTKPTISFRINQKKLQQQRPDLWYELQIAGLAIKEERAGYLVIRPN